MIRIRTRYQENQTVTNAIIQAAIKPTRPIATIVSLMVNLGDDELTADRQVFDRTMSQCRRVAS
jgi:hypothetical protein